MQLQARNTLASDLAALASQPLPPRAQARLAQALAEVRRDLALADLVLLLDPDGRRSRWSVALEVEARLSRFEDTGWPRVRDGYRLPRDHVERCLTVILAADGPRSARRLVDLL